ncbi:MAG TPA: aldehyde dehydrogenase family protein [Actinomycetota bacterium]|nr:aldehyde dehydrogenase family protein [Actinomycetota bacterium]
MGAPRTRWDGALSVRGPEPFLVAGAWRRGESTFEVRSPYDGGLVGEVCRPGAADVEDALAAARDAFDRTRLQPAHARAEVLVQVSQRIGERGDELAELIAREGGKPLRWARVEVSRAASTFRWAAEEVRRSGGEVLRLDADASAGSRLGMVRRFPFGPVLGISPFNFPLNLVAHKMAPALGVGAPFVLKPATTTPLSALVLAEIAAECELPPGALSVLPVSGAGAEPMVTDPRIAKVSFTGSGEVGWRLKGLAPRKRFTLELGGNAGVIVHSDADVGRAAERIAVGGNYQAGQSCIAVQRVFVHRPIFQELVSRLATAVEALTVGDPLDPATDVGPLIDHGALERVASWVDEALAGGAEAVTGGKRRDPFYEPTVLVGTRREMKVRCDEVFGPVVTVDTYDGFEEALREVNATRYGLQAGVFTRDLDRVLLAHRELAVGGVVVNDVSSFRADQMPYGGAKESGYGREGLRYAMEEMTEGRILVLSDVPL